MAVILFSVVLFALAAGAWFVGRRVEGLRKQLAQAVSGTVFVSAALLLTAHVTASMNGGAPFGIESLKRPYGAWIERIERPTQPLVQYVRLGGEP